MTDHKLTTIPVHFKLMVTALICLIGLTYLTLLANIFIDTELKVSLIIEGYGLMDFMELTENAHRYLPFYTIYLFAVPVFIFMFSSYSSRIKNIFAVVPFIIIVIDISSMYLIRYLWEGFAYVLFLAGTTLALTFVTLFVLIITDVWLKNK